MELRPYRMTHATVYRLARHPFTVARDKRGWHLRIENDQAQEWVERNQPVLADMFFRTRRELLDLLQALHAVDPLPELPVLPASALRRQDDGSYLLTDPKGVEYRITRCDHTLTGPYKWLADVTIGGMEFQLGPYQTLSEIRTDLARAGRAFL